MSQTDVAAMVKPKQMNMTRQNSVGADRLRMIDFTVIEIEALYPRRSLSQPGEGHEIFPYLLRDVEINGPNQVWCSDITYIPMQHGFMYLVAVMDWWSRYVLGWELSNTMDAEFCIRAWEQAM